MRIGVFDSGIGGINVLKELRKASPNNHYIYVGDTLNLPYGEKNKEQLFELASQIIRYLLTFDVDLIIIACGTVSSNVTEMLRQQFSVPIFDILSPMITTINESAYTKVGFIGTNATIKSGYVQGQISYKIELISQGCPNFVPLIENRKIDTLECQQNVENYLREMKEKKIQALILGCTHYPLLSDSIRSFLGSEVELIDLGKTLQNKVMLESNESPKLELYFSKITDELEKNIEWILEEKIPFKEIKL